MTDWLVSKSKYIEDYKIEHMLYTGDGKPAINGDDFWWTPITGDNVDVLDAFTMGLKEINKQIAAKDKKFTIEELEEKINDVQRNYLISRISSNKATERDYTLKIIALHDLLDELKK
jgi:hypothetical protein